MTPPAAGRSHAAGPALIVFAHLRWNFVYQRPQQLLTRLARQHPAHPVFYIEEPVFEPCVPTLRTWQAAPGITVCRPHTPVRSAGFHDAQLPMLRDLVRQLGAEAGEHVAWLYTPMALPLLQELAPLAVVYDCMDELTAFRGAPRQLAQRESALLKVADLVFTGGGSLYRARRERHPEVHCFPSSVDAAHFAAARAGERASHPLQRHIPRPRLGFYGVLDERIDYDLIATVAALRPEWQIVLVGPTAKVDPRRLPRAPNLHWLGRQSYADLPRFLAGWDVCLLPFAQNEATRNISPTKVLEYMAADRPIVSTPVADVEQPYSDVIAIAANPYAFADACERALIEADATALGSTDERADAGAVQRRRARMRAIVAATSWDETATQMRALLCAQIARLSQPAMATEPARHTPDGTPDRTLLASAASVANVANVTNEGAPPAGSMDRPRTSVAGPASHPVVIIGAGPTGLAAAMHLPADTLLLERQERVGGWCRSIEDHGFTFDHAGHIMFSKDPWVLGMYEQLLGPNLHWQDREAWIFSHGVHTRYPFQGALYGLPAPVLKECLIGAIEARFGPLDGSAANAEGPGAQATPPANFAEFINAVWGKGVARHFALPYNRKLWTVPLEEIETSWLAGRVPLPDLNEMIDGALTPAPKPMGPNARFGYPLEGGFQALMDGFLPHIPGRIECGARVIRIDPTQRLVVLADGRRFRYERLVSTMPLPELVRVLGDAAPPAARAAAAGLRHVAVRCVNLGVGRANLSDKHWIYYPEDPVFHRIFLQGNASPRCNPPGGFGLTCEITYSPAKPLPATGRELVERCVADCVAVGLLRPDDRLITANQIDMPYAYVVYDHARAANVAQLRGWLEGQDIHLAGRYAEWEYYNSDHAFVAGRRAAERILAATGDTTAVAAVAAGQHAGSARTAFRARGQGG